MTPAVNDHLDTLTVVHCWDSPPEGGWYLQPDYYQAGSRFIRVRPQSENNLRRSNGTRPPGNYSSYGGYFRADAGSLILTHVPTGTRLRYEGRLVDARNPVGGVDFPDLGESETYAIRDALGHYSEASSQMNSALRQVHQTVGLTTQYYRELAKTVDLVHRAVTSRAGFRKDMKKYFSGSWKKAPQRYIEYLYGVVPLAGDIQNAMEQLTDSRDRGESMILLLKGKWKGQQMRDVVCDGPDYVTWNCRVLGTRKSKCTLSFLLPDWFWEELPPVTAFSEQYELMPWSFALDWVLPISGWLKGFEGLPLRPFFYEGGLTSFTSERGTEARYRSLPPWSPDRDTISVDWTGYRLVRTRLESFPTEMVMRLPRLENRLGLFQMSQAAALAGQAFAKLAKSVT